MYLDTLLLYCIMAKMVQTRMHRGSRSKRCIWIHYCFIVPN
jgi:hypothetical protein